MKRYPDRKSPACSPFRLPAAHCTKSAFVPERLGNRRLPGLQAGPPRNPAMSARSSSATTPMPSVAIQPM